MEITEIYKKFLAHPLVLTDTRSIQSKSLFFCLKGANFNGNTFAKQALELGAAYAIIDEKDYYINERTILVDDVLKTLQNLANYHRKQFKIPVIGLTGSNGKTTTKELIASVLTQKFKCHYTSGNLNNHIGVPLTLLGLTREHEIAVIEMGANHPKEIAELAAIAEPTHGLVTNVGKAHLEGFGGFEGVINTKKELYDYIEITDGTAFYNGDNPIITKMCSAVKHKLMFSFTQDAYVTGTIESLDDSLKISWQKEKEQRTIATSHLIGIYNAENILAAITIGSFLGMSAELINKGIEAYMPQNNRSQIVLKDTNRLILDAYNANPTSMEQALKNIAAMNSANKIAVLGDMLELGEYSDVEHDSIVEQALKSANKLLLTGKHFIKSAAKYTNENICTFENAEELGKWLKENPIRNSLVLIKGSRGIKLETVVQYI